MSDTDRAGQYFDAAAAFIEARAQKAMLAATRRGAEKLAGNLRTSIRGAGLGNLGNALGSTSDEKRGGIHRQSGGGTSASGLVIVRSRSERTLGALEAYTAGSSIRPRRGRWLWIPSDDILRVAGGKGQRERVTPANWTRLGMDRRIGPLVFIPNKGRPLLIVRSASVNLGKARGSAKALTKTGRARKGQTAVPIVVAFIGIPNTTRAARIDVRAEHAKIMGKLPQIFANELRRV